jgi:hypothetical protein
VLAAIQFNNRLGFIAQKSEMYSPIACCRLNFTPFSLLPRKYVHSLSSAGVSTFLNPRARSYPNGVVRLAGISGFYPTPSLPKCDIKLFMYIEKLPVVFGEGACKAGGVPDPQQEKFG